MTVNQPTCHSLQLGYFAPSTGNPKRFLHLPAVGCKGQSAAQPPFQSKPLRWGDYWNYLCVANRNNNPTNRNNNIGFRCAAPPGRFLEGQVRCFYGRTLSPRVKFPGLIPVGHCAMFNQRKILPPGVVGRADRSFGWRSYSSKLIQS